MTTGDTMLARTGTTTAPDISTLLERHTPRPAKPDAAEQVTMTHLGTTGITVGELVEALPSVPKRPVRSGHVGNWSEIRAGRTGLVDYNRYICHDFDLGAPLLHCHTAVENRDRSDGDTIYLPGGSVRRGRYERLDLREWVGTGFVPLSEDVSRCVAYVYVETERGHLPLPAARWAECRDNFSHTQTVPDVLLAREGDLRTILGALVRASIEDANPEARLAQVFGGSVDPRGRRGPGPVPTDDGFACGDTVYADPDALVAAAVECLRDGSVEHPADAPRDDALHRPLLGAQALLFLVALLETEIAPPTEGPRRHLHWGAISMSGYPPKSQGYFNRRSTRQTLRFLARAVAPQIGGLLPLHFALLPAPVLSLLAPAEFTRDVEAMTTLFDTVLSGTEPPGGDPNVVQGQIDAVVSTWLTEHASRLSPYVLNRFGVSRSVQNGTLELPGNGAPGPLGPLAELTVQQATMLVGALMTQAPDHV